MIRINKLNPTLFLIVHQGTELVERATSRDEAERIAQRLAKLFGATQIVFRVGL